METMREDNRKSPQDVPNRREFLKLSGAAITTLVLPAYLMKAGLPKTLYAQKMDYPSTTIGKLNELRPGETITFKYPWDHNLATNYLIMLNEPAGGGIGPDHNVVAFNSFCTHQGGPLTDQFHADSGVAGPCPLHWTTFDLTRHGMVVSGHATQGLPQIILELQGDDILATGVMGLIFGYHDNQVDPNA
jgi:arsenite oxidase small subunit